jgi:hypothetical protein
MEHFYYEDIYDLLKGQRDQKDKALNLRILKAKILRLNRELRRKILLCSEAYTGDTEEEPTQHHIIKGKK